MLCSILKFVFNNIPPTKNLKFPDMNCTYKQYWRDTYFVCFMVLWHSLLELVVWRYTQKKWEEMKSFWIWKYCKYGALESKSLSYLTNSHLQEK